MIKNLLFSLVLTFGFIAAGNAYAQTPVKKEETKKECCKDKKHAEKGEKKDCCKDKHHADKGEKKDCCKDKKHGEKKECCKSKKHAEKKE